MLHFALLFSKASRLPYLPISSPVCLVFPPIVPCVLRISRIVRPAIPMQIMTNVCVEIFVAARELKNNSNHVVVLSRSIKFVRIHVM